MSSADEDGSAAVPVEEGGEPTCLLALLCPSCGRVPDDANAARCPACGADLGADPAAHGPTG